MRLWLLWQSHWHISYVTDFAQILFINNIIWNKKDYYVRPLHAQNRLQASDSTSVNYTVINNTWLLSASYYCIAVWSSNVSVDIIRIVVGSDVLDRIRTVCRLHILDGIRTLYPGQMYFTESGRSPDYKYFIYPGLKFCGSPLIPYGLRW